MIAENAHMKKRVARKSASGGRALLTGLVRCARCARMMRVDLSNRTYGHQHRGHRPRRAQVLQDIEDAPHVVRQRLEGICAAAGCRLVELDVRVITAPTLRLDLAADAKALERAVAALKPRLLILDPFVRPHRIDDNGSGEVAPLLAQLRELQRR